MSMPDDAAACPQVDLHMLVSWLLYIMANFGEMQLAPGGRRKVPAGRLEAAAGQLLPPLLDGLRARRLGRLDNAQPADARHQQMQPMNILVGTGTAFTQAPMHETNA